MITVASDESDVCKESCDSDELSDMDDSNEDRSCWSTTVKSFWKMYTQKEKTQWQVSPVDFSVVTLTVRFPECKSSSNTSASTSVPDSSVKCSSVSSSNFWMTGEKNVIQSKWKIRMTWLPDIF